MSEVRKIGGIVPKPSVDSMHAIVAQRNLPPEERKRGRNVKEPVKMCVKCTKMVVYSGYYKNRGWTAQAYHDAWCKDCAKKYCTTKENIKEYCWLNNRAWNEWHWDKAIDAARYTLSTNKTYIKAPRERKGIMEEEAACKVYLAQMNLINVYQYSENVAPEQGHYIPYSADNKDGELAESAIENMRLDNELEYSSTWNGLFTKREIDYLDEYYADLEKDFSLDDVSMRDYARKVAKASLLHDDAFNKIRTGAIESKEYNAIKNNFDELSKSANFAACRRRVDDKIMVLPLGEVVEYLEVNKKIHTRKDVWEQDSVDQMIIEMGHIATALGIDTGGGGFD